MSDSLTSVMRRLGVTSDLFNTYMLRLGAQEHLDKWRLVLQKALSEVRRFVITEKAFSWLKGATTAFTFKTLLRHYAKRALTPLSM